MPKAGQGCEINWKPWTAFGKALPKQFVSILMIVIYPQRGHAAREAAKGISE